MYGLETQQSQVRNRSRAENDDEAAGAAVVEPPPPPQESLMTTEFASSYTVVREVDHTGGWLGS